MPRTCHDLRYEVHRDNLAAELWTLAATIDGVDPALPVPTCGAWTMRDLVEHTGHVHRWATAIVGKLSPRRLNRQAADWPLPAAPDGYAGWLAAGGQALTEILTAADPDAPVWAWGADQHVRFWARRMLHETTVHRCDAQLALGVPTPVDPAVAVDGIDEFLDNLPHAANFAPGVRELRGSGERLRFGCQDQHEVWTVTLTEDGFTWSHTMRGGPVDAAVVADSCDLYLLMWGRVTLSDPRVEAAGDPDLLRHWVRYSAV
jgi:uncharacterized protein (TIGR03083 family)